MNVEIYAFPSYLQMKAITITKNYFLLTLSENVIGNYPNFENELSVACEDLIFIVAFLV